ncbi:MAG TPA: hypothetical protein VK011_03045 [Acidimicrobiia bacterium]|nr:hypothetical protein [Acidimicrobiia bacterium]
MIRAAALLGPFDNEELRRLLAPVRPDDVVVRLMPRVLDRIVPRWVAAVTAPWAVYVRPQALTSSDTAIARLVVHELVHWRQWHTLGVVGFLRSYLGDYFRGRMRGLTHRQAYLEITLEQEAAEAARRI